MEKRAKRQDHDAPKQEACDDIRCGCGRLIARLVPGGVELKCGRCRSVTIIPLTHGGELEGPRARGARG